MPEQLPDPTSDSAPAPLRRRIGRRAAALGILGGLGLGAAYAGHYAYWWTPPTRRALDVASAHARAASGEVLLVDIRRPEEWQATGIGAPALALDMRRPDFTRALAEAAGGDPDRPIALICARGVRSARLAASLAEAGFTQIIDVPEGMMGSGAGPGWIAAGLPLRAATDAPG
jgi:rhodanese-related sulfurtransferase